MMFAIWLAASLAATALLWLGLRRSGRPALSHHALSLTALATAGALAAFGWWIGQDSQVVLSQAAEGQTYHDTYYTVTKGHYLTQLALFYLPLTLTLLTIEGLGPRTPRRLMLPLFAALQTGVLATVLIVAVPPVAMARRYADYPQMMQTLNQISTLAAALAYISLLLLGALLLYVLTAALLRQFR